MLHPQLSTILSPNTPERLFFPLSDPLVSYKFCFFPSALSSRPRQASCVTGRSGKKKKGLKTLWHASPKSIFGEHSFFFFFENKKATGRNRQYWGEGGLFLIWPGLPPVLPASVRRRTTALWGRRVAQTKGGEVFFLQNRGQNYGPSS